MTADEMVDDAKSRVQAVTREELETEMEGDVLVVDVRDPRERWERGAMPGARSVPRGMIEFWADPHSEYHKSFLKPDQRTVVYCAAGKRSALAADVLLKLGYTNVAHLELGFDAWKESGGAVEEVPIPDAYRK